MPPPPDRWFPALTSGSFAASTIAVINRLAFRRTVRLQLLTQQVHFACACSRATFPPSCRFLHQWADRGKAVRKSPGNRVNGHDVRRGFPRNRDRIRLFPSSRPAAAPVQRQNRAIGSVNDVSPYPWPSTQTSRISSQCLCDFQSLSISKADLRRQTKDE